MTAHEIFGRISSHMVKGLMIHSDYADYYYFLNLVSYGEMHDKHYSMEVSTHRELKRWYVEHYNKLLPKEDFSYDTVIPQSWLKYSREDVDTNTIRTSVKSGLTAWVEWERETKSLYESMFKELMNIGDITGALYVQDLICDVSKELDFATSCMLTKNAVDYGISEIMQDQKS